MLAKPHQMEREQLLAVPITESNSGLHQFKAVTQVLEDWGLKEHILGFGIDTTSDMTTRLEKWTEEACWWTACAHHHYEIHIKKWLGL